MTALAVPSIDDIDYDRWQRIPYCELEQGLNTGFNCWGLMRAFLQEALGKDVAAIDVDFTNKQQVATEADRQMARGCWQQIPFPEPFCVVQMTHATIAHHVGVWVPVNRGGVLHTTTGTGSIIQRRELLPQTGFTITGFFKFIG